MQLLTAINFRTFDDLKKKPPYPLADIAKLLIHPSPKETTDLFCLYRFVILDINIHKIT